MSIMNYSIENNTHECQECGMKFYNSAELVNHMRKFCSGAGLNSLEGLAKYEHSSNMPKKLKNYGAHSLGSMKYQPIFSASELAKQAKQVADHREQLAINRPYSNANSQAVGKSRINNYNETDLGIYERSIVKKVQLPETKKSRAGYGERVLGNSEVSMQSLGGFKGQPSKNNIHTSQADNNYYSPPSDLPLVFAKHHGPSVLEKSNSSIAKMSVSQKHDYATDKLVQLDHIAELYDKSGGMSMDFRKNLQKMRKFYKKMLEDDQPTKQYPGQFAISRVQTPINKLRDLNGEEPNNRKKGPQDSLDEQIKNMANKQKEEPNIKKSKTDNNNNPYVNSPNFMGYQQPGQYPFYPPYNPYAPQPQIIMMPPYQQNQSNNDINEQIKYFQKVIEVKNEENKKLMQMLLDTKKQKNHSQVKSRVEQIRESRISQMRNNNNIYHMETPMESVPLTEEKILLALQRQQLDELRLLSALPEELQQLKMQSVMKLIQQRTELEKEILQQKVKRLEEQKRNQLHEEQVRLDKDDWANEQRKKLIGYQMGDVLEQFKQKVQGENESDEQDSAQDYGGEGNQEQE